MPRVGIFTLSRIEIIVSFLLYLPEVGIFPFVTLPPASPSPGLFGPKIRPLPSPRLLRGPHRPGLERLWSPSS